MGDVVSLFSGCGGMALGFQQTGHTIRYGVDKNEYATETFRKNIAPCYETDITTVTPHEFAGDTDDVDIVTGGPPCQDFSVANYYSRGGEKTNLVFVFADWVAEIDPDVFVMENVTGIKSTGDVFEQLQETFNTHGYETTVVTENAAECGVPQRRNRTVLIGSQTADVDSFNLDECENSRMTVGEAFADLPSLAAGESDSSYDNHRAPNHQSKTVERIAQRDYGEELYDSWTEKIRLDPNDVAPTLKAGKRANYHFAHPEDDRGLTIRERARLQSFPDDFVFYGPITEQRKQTGNAVPPKLARCIGNALL